MNLSDESERYTFTNKAKGIIHKVDSRGVPDKEGLEFHLLAEAEGGYTVYIYHRDTDNSQPTSVYFIDKKYFTQREV